MLNKYPHLAKKPKFLIDIEMNCECDNCKRLNEEIRIIMKRNELTLDKKAKKEFIEEDDMDYRNR